MHASIHIIYMDECGELCFRSMEANLRGSKKNRGREAGELRGAGTKEGPRTT